MHCASFLDASPISHGCEPSATEMKAISRQIPVENPPHKATSNRSAKSSQGEKVRPPFPGEHLVPDKNRHWSTALLQCVFLPSYPAAPHHLQSLTHKLDLDNLRQTCDAEILQVMVIAGDEARNVGGCKLQKRMLRVDPSDGPTTLVDNGIADINTTISTS